MKEDGDVRLERGEEMGRFNMGSTVISILPPGVIAGDRTGWPQAGDAVRMGQKIARLLRPGTDAAPAGQNNDEDLDTTEPKPKGAES